LSKAKKNHAPLFFPILVGKSNKQVSDQLTAGNKCYGKGKAELRKREREWNRGKLF
jgi:hypothetical protein